MAVWINEFHYDNDSTDVGEFIELAGTAGTDLSGWTLLLYNGNGGAVYDTITLSGTIADQQNGFGTISFARAGIQNGAPDGIALVNGTTVVQFLSYEGSFTAVGGAANGLVSTDIGISQLTTEPVGSSLHLVGTGDEYSDFTWAKALDDSPGAVNGGQSFGTAPGETVSINDVSVTEGNTGTVTLTFTVTRSGNTGAFTLDFATTDGTATAPGDYAATSGTLTFLAGGALSQTISVTINGDTAPEANETLSVVLSGLANTTGTTTLADGTGLGTITNDDIVFTEIAAIQGAGHKSGLITVNTGGGTGVAQAGNSGADRYNVEGVVTAIGTNGFWIQDATPDANDATSDGIFVFTSAAPAGTITVGETVQVLGARVDEFRAGTNNLTLTQLNATIAGASLVELGGNTAIAAVVLGVDRILPTGAIEDDNFTSFDIATDAADFWESLEGMVVEVPNPIAISPTNEFRTRDPANSANAEGPPNEEIWVVTPGGFDAASQTAGGGLIISETGDFNPERIQLDDLLPSIDLPDVDVGAELSTVRGVVNYDFGNYEVLIATAPTVETPSTLTPETTTITRDARQLTLGVYNVENLDAEVEDTSTSLPGGVAGSDLYTRLGNSDDDVGSGKYALHAQQIVLNMGAPTILALQEVQDDDGAEISNVVDATRTLQTLVDLIQATYGITYAFAFENPPASNQDGGQPNANIRPAFLYRPDQVTLLGTERLTDPNIAEADAFAGDDFASSRKPLVGEFSFNGVSLTVINNHLNSKGGDNALFGNVQPPVLGSELQRTEQAKIINAYVDGLLAADPGARVMVVGDLNDFGWSTPVRTITGAAEGTPVLFNLAEELLPVNARYSYNFDGNTQELDHQLVSDALLNAAAPEFDIVHVNSEFADQASDHDPSLSRFDFRAFAERLLLGAGADVVDGLGGADTIEGLGGLDQLFGSMGDDRLDGGEGADTLRGGLDDDMLLGGAGDDSLLGGFGNDTLDGGADADVLRGGAGDDLYILGDGDRAIEAAAEGADTVSGATSLRLGPAIEVGVLTGAADAFIVANGLDNLLVGNDGANRLLGEGGADSLLGGAGIDVLLGGLGADTLDGGLDRDRLFGGAGADTFVFGTGGFPGDAVFDFEAGVDRLLVLEAALGVAIGAGALDPARFEANADGQAGAAGGSFVFETDTARLWWDVDGAGAGRALVASFVALGAAPTAADIVIG